MLRQGGLADRSKWGAEDLGCCGDYVKSIERGKLGLVRQLKTPDSKQNMSLSSRFFLRAANPLASMNFIHKSLPRDGDPSASLARGFPFWVLLLFTRFLPPSWESTSPLIPSRSVICREGKDPIRVSRFVPRNWRRFSLIVSPPAVTLTLHQFFPSLFPANLFCTLNRARNSAAFAASRSVIRMTSSLNFLAISNGAQTLHFEVNHGNLSII